MSLNDRMISQETSAYLLASHVMQATGYSSKRRANWCNRILVVIMLSGWITAAIYCSWRIYHGA